MKHEAGRTATARIAAFVAALVLVLQSAFAFAAPPVERDIFGNVICADGSGGPMPAGDHGARHMPDCCVLACSAAFQPAADQPPSAEWPAAARNFATPIHLPAATALSPHDRRTPANPRAPPAA